MPSVIESNVLAEGRALHYALLGCKELAANRPRGGRYLAIALRIGNDSDAPQSVDLREFRLRTLADGRCPRIAAIPEKAAHGRHGKCVIEPGSFARVTLAFIVPDAGKRFRLRLPRETNAASFEPRQLSMA